MKLVVTQDELVTTLETVLGEVSIENAISPTDRAGVFTSVFIVTMTEEQFSGYDALTAINESHRLEV